MIQRSLSKKFSRSLSRVVALSLLLFSVVAISYNFFALDKAFNQRLDYVAGLTRSSLPYAMWNVDRTAMEELVDALFLDPDVAYVALLMDGSTMVEKARAGQEGRPFGVFQESAHHFSRAATIRFEDEEIGTIQIALSKSALYRQFLLDILAVLLLAAILITLISIRSIKMTERFVFRPLKELENNAASIAAGDLEAAIDTRAGDEIGSLARSFDTMRQSVRQLVEDLRAANRGLELRVAERTAELREKNEVLDATLQKVEAANRQILESIHYSKLIQRSLLPNMEKVREFLPDHFCIWQPRDIVGGDLFNIQRIGDYLVVAVIDCTGHGVPGAFMTMIAASSLRQVLNDPAFEGDPAEVLGRLNVLVKTALRQDTAEAEADDGLDASICVIRNGEDTLRFAGARLPLLFVEDGQVNIVPGDRQSIGYKRSDLGFRFTNHALPVDPGMRFYLTTDGFVDQKGGENGFSFGNRRFRQLLTENQDRPLNQQEEILHQSLENYSLGFERVDDVTVLGFSVPTPFVRGRTQ